MLPRWQVHATQARCVAPIAWAPHNKVWCPSHRRHTKGLVEWNSFAKSLFYVFLCTKGYFCENRPVTAGKAWAGGGALRMGCHERAQTVRCLPESGPTRVLSPSPVMPPLKVSKVVMMMRFRKWFTKCHVRKHGYRGQGYWHVCFCYVVIRIH
jgi:hypothetical protein